MEMNFETMLQRLTEFIQKETKTETVIGDPFQLGGFSCVPVIRIGVGFGSGGGMGDSQRVRKAEGGGAAAGIGIDPIGFLVTKDNEISFINAHQSKGLTSIFEKVPELLEKLAKKKETANA